METTTTTKGNKMANTYTKLRDGSWGVRIHGSASAGQTVNVTKKSGEVKAETICRVIWTGNGVTLASIQPTARAATRSATGYPSRASSSGRCRECHGEIKDCSHHRAMGGLCGACAFDEYDC
jgi:hypothetical protein